ncbi:hypothetical protein RND71_009165 [Anisodus tanguticus]|uniref:Pentatricopeptide repeat-containing protein n=1 Tax=Anisodus tanguticus TaxID=243964 RepID=A0AAE1SGQ3_9SOLA|nr:hypothetical protein RND71_009165 [Anisodus tanguticus]
MASRISIRHLISTYLASHQSKALKFLNSCQSLSHLFQIQSHLIITGLLQVQNPSFSSRFLKLCTQHCDIQYTALVFRCIHFPDTFTVNTVINAYASSSMRDYAIVFYYQTLKNGFFPNSFTFTPLISACAKMGRVGSGQKCHGQVVKNGVDGVLHVGNSLMHFYSCCGFIGLARKVFDEMPRRDVVSWNSIVNGYVKMGELVVARELFDAMPYRNLVGWNVMMNGHLNSNNPGKCLKLFREMAQSGVNGNDATIVIALTACARSARMKEGKSVHGCVIKASKDLNLITSTTLIHMYSRCGREEIARLVFDRISVKNIVCWNAMILGYCIHGNPKDGLNLYSDLLSSRSEGPDEITFVGILCACAREGLLTEARKHFGEMSDVFGIKPSFAHYWCMANLLAKFGLMQEAIETLKNIPVESNLPLESSLWSELLGSARFRGDVILGEQIANKLIDQDPKNFWHYLLLVNIYAAAGRWDEVTQTKERMKKRGIERTPGCGLKDLKEIVHNMSAT